MRAAGLPVCRQRPSTAKGIVFISLEDEYGLANLVVYPQLFDRQRTLIVTSAFLIARGCAAPARGRTHRRPRLRAVGRAYRSPYPRLAQLSLAADRPKSLRSNRDIPTRQSAADEDVTLFLPVPVMGIRALGSRELVVLAPNCVRGIRHLWEPGRAYAG